MTYHSEYYLKNKERLDKQNMKWYHENKKNVLYQRWVQSLQEKYSLSEEQYYEIERQQNFQCAICGIDKPMGRGKWHVDHCHETNKVRGLLCQQCNVGLGHFKDDIVLLEKAVRYLKKCLN